MVITSLVLGLFLQDFAEDIVEEEVSINLVWLGAIGLRIREEVHFVLQGLLDLVSLVRMPFEALAQNAQFGQAGVVRLQGFLNIFSGMNILIQHWLIWLSRLFLNGVGFRLFLLFLFLMLGLRLCV